MKYPTHRELDVLVSWVNGGAALLDEPKNGQRHRRRRCASLGCLKNMTARYDLSDDFRSMPCGLAGNPLSTHLSYRLRDRLYYESRVRGLLTRWDLDSPYPEISTVPLTGTQARCLWLMSWGADHASTALAAGIQPDTVKNALARARAEHGCSTTAALVACAYRNRWFPDHEELRELHSLIGTRHLAAA